MEEILHHLSCIKNLINNGINYQPQLVFFSPDFWTINRKALTLSIHLQAFKCFQFPVLPCVFLEVCGRNSNSKKLPLQGRVRSSISHLDWQVKRCTVSQEAMGKQLPEKQDPLLLLIPINWTPLKSSKTDWPFPKNGKRPPYVPGRTPKEWSTYIYLHENHKFKPNVCKYSSLMEHLGTIIQKGLFWKELAEALQL